MPGLDPNVEFLKEKAYVLLLRDPNGIGLGGILKLNEKLCKIGRS